MKTKTLILLAGSLVLCIFMGIVQAQEVSEGEALTVAKNWISVILDKKGTWGGADRARIESIEEFMRGDQVIGYFCRVNPQGFIIVSPRREMAPIKAYSAHSDLQPDLDEGLTDLLKGKMEHVLTKIRQIEQRNQAQRQVTGQAPEITESLEIDYRPVWERLESDVEGFLEDENVTEPTLEEGPGERTTVPEGEADELGEESNYQEGEALLSSNWHQSPPYNNQCPLMGCSNSNGRALVGCVATAGAQIMNYWSWPPWGEGGSPYTDTYDWLNMLESVTTASPAAAQNAVAELSHEVGVAVGMSYGCSASTASTYDMENVFEDHYRYSNVYKRDRNDYAAVAWFDLMKDEFNYNRPVQYRITDHSIVGDGWQEYGSPTIRQYHMNYGWSGTGSDTWYTLDSMTSDPEDEEYLLENIRPEPYLTTLNGTFTRNASFPYRYFYRDTWGGSGTFDGGQRIQFLPGIEVECTTGTVAFRGSAADHSYLFTEGDLSRGIHIHLNSSTAVKLYAGGTIKFQ